MKELLLLMRHGEIYSLIVASIACWYVLALILANWFFSVSKNAISASNWAAILSTVVSVIAFGLLTIFWLASLLGAVFLVVAVIVVILLIVGLQARRGQY